jgi:NADH:ubiquinone oxidoreductase subunit 3 (subunit A)
MEVIPTLLFVIFAVLATVGAFLALYHWRGVKAGIAGAVASLLFFIALFAALVYAMRHSGLM